MPPINRPQLNSNRAKHPFLILNALLLAILIGGKTSHTLAASPELEPNQTNNVINNWVLKKERQNIQLYIRPIKNSDQIEIKSTAIINSPFEKTRNLFTNGDGCDSWQSMCRSSEILNSDKQGNQLIYVVLNLPWPTADRDLVLFSRHEIDTEKKLITAYFKPATDSYPQQHIIRGELSGHYTLQAISPKETKFTWIVSTDLKINFNPNYVNSRLISTTFKDVSQLVKYAEK